MDRNVTLTNDNAANIANTQQAVNDVLASSDLNNNVIFPEGDYPFNQVRDGAVKINLSLLQEGGTLNIFGAGGTTLGTTNYGDSREMPTTILRSGADGSYWSFFSITGVAGKASIDPTIPEIRFSGISFLGKVTDISVGGGQAIILLKVENFRVDHCFIDSFNNSGILPHMCKGLVEHCTFDNSFARHQAVPPNKVSYGYGILIAGDSNTGLGGQATWMPLDDILGKWDTGHTYMAGPISIEDCIFYMCRHAIASTQYAFYVSRSNKFMTPRSPAMSYCDVHGKGFPAGRGAEIYNNTYYGGLGVGWRGGGGVIFSNTFVNYNGVFIFYDGYTDDPDYFEHPHDLWIWGNSYGSASVYTMGDWLTAGVHYFTDDPIITDPAPPRPNYTPYIYPHQFITGEEPPLPPPPETITPFSTELEEGIYIISMPESVTLGGETYNFVSWEDGSTNPIRTINLQSDTTISATYEKSITAGILQVRAYTDETEIDVPVEVIGVGIKITPFNVSLEFGTYTIVAPSSTIVGDEIHIFSSWEDGSTNPERTLNFTSDMTIEARYIPPTPIPPEEPTKGFLEIHGFYGETEVKAKGRVFEENLKFTTPTTIELEAGTYTIICRYRARLKRWTVKVVAGQTVRVDFQFRLPTGLSKTLPRVTQIYGFPVLSRIEDKKQEWRR